MKRILSYIVPVIVLSALFSPSYAQNTNSAFYTYLIKSIGPTWFEFTKVSVESYVTRNNLKPLLYNDLEEQTKGELKSCFSSEILQSFRIYNNIPFDDPKTWIGKMNWVNKQFKGVTPAAQTFGNTIYMQNFIQGKWESRKTLIHELVHVVQYKELGYEGFKEEYKKGLVETGSYYSIPLEDEAYSYCNTLFYGGMFHTKFHAEVASGELFLKERPNTQNVLMKIVGNFDPVKIRGVWRDKSRAYYKQIAGLEYHPDYPLCTEVLGEHFFTEEGIEKYLCVLSTNSELHDCHACAPSQGFLFLAKSADGWHQLYCQLNLAMLGATGKPPIVNFVEVGNKTIGAVLTMWDMHQGYAVTLDAIYVYYHDVFQEAIKITTNQDCAGCNDPDFSLTRKYHFIPKANAEFYDISITTHKDPKREKVKRSRDDGVYSFQNGKYLQASR